MLSQTCEETPSNSFMYALILTLVLLAAGLLVARLIFPKESTQKSAIYYGRFFAAVTAVLASLSSLETFYSVEPTEVIARYLLFMTAFPALGFALGYGFGLVKFGVKSVGRMTNAQQSMATGKPKSVEMSRVTDASELKDEEGSVDRDDGLLDQAYAVAYEEVETVNLKKGLWARLLVEADGNVEKTRLSYVRARANQVYKELMGSRALSEKKQDFQSEELGRGVRSDNATRLGSLLQAVSKHKDFDSNVALIEFFGGSVTLLGDDFIDVVFLGKTYHFSSSKQFFHFCESGVCKHAKAELSVG